MRTESKPQGPASYFPSIEKKYGKPMAHWFQLLEAVKAQKHMEQVAFLKEQHQGHGHAHAVVAVCRAQSSNSHALTHAPGGWPTPP